MQGAGFTGLATGGAALGKGLLATGRGFLFMATSIGKAGLALLTNPMTWIILGIVAAVAALAGAAYLVYRNWGVISEWFGQRGQDIKGAFSNSIGGIARLILNWSPLGLLWSGFTSALSALGVNVPAGFSSLGSAIIDGLIGEITGVLSALWTIITDVAGSVASWFADALGINSPSRVFMEFGGWTIEGLIQELTAKLTALKDSVVGIASSVTGWFKDKLDIHSPSRVFAAPGGHTVDGLTLGLERQRDDPAKSITDIASRVRAAGAGLALSAMALPAAAMPSISSGEPIRFDSRPPLAAGGGQQSADYSISIGDINVQPSPGMDERELAQYVAQEVQRALAQAQRDQGARRRSSMWDRD